MPPAIQFTAFSDDPLCHGYHWEVADQARLANLVAHIVVAQYKHAASIISGQASTAEATPDTVKAQAIDRLTKVNTKEARWHRDGWVFQHIAWIAALEQTSEAVISSTPQQAPAFKGFDAVLIPLTSSHTAKFEVIICEDKATQHPRKTITQKVWPEVREVERGARDADVKFAVNAILDGHSISNSTDFLAQIFLNGKKRFRISITAKPAHKVAAKRQALFKDYDGHVPNPSIARRRAELLCLPDMRTWMDTFSAEVVRVITSL